MKGSAAVSFALVVTATLFSSSSAFFLGGSCGSEHRCGSFLFLSSYKVRQIGESSDVTCEESCTFFPGWKTWTWFGLFPKWECGSCADVTSLVALDGPTAELSVLSCAPNTLIIRGDAIESIAVGNSLIYLNGGDDAECSGCSPIYRKIVSVASGTTEGTKVLETKLLTMVDLFGAAFVDADSVFGGTALEPLFACPHTTGAPRSLRLAEPLAIPENRAKQQGGGFCGAYWFQKDRNGSCLYTNCAVGKQGDPANCFSCKRGCDNGCGAEDIPALNFDGDFFGLYDFGGACCMHDHCWSSTLGKEPCDYTFLKDMLSSCPRLSSNSVFSVIANALVPPTRLWCHESAMLLFSIVYVLGNGSYETAQAKQKAHEATDECFVECLVDSDCPEDYPACGPLNECVECVRNTDCSPDSVCGPHNECVECVLHSDCPVGFECGPLYMCEAVECFGDPCCRPGDCFEGGAVGDPHIVTFDNLEYSCQGSGDFVLFESSSGLKVHVHFKKNSPFVTLASAVALQSGSGETTVQLSSISDGGSLVLLINGLNVTFSAGYEDQYVLVTTSEFGSNKILLKTSGVLVYADVKLARSPSQHLAVRVSLPRSSIGSTAGITGLLGSPDGIFQNDWMKIDGSVIPVPLLGLSDRPGFEYCLAHWCIRNETDSLLTTLEGDNFNSSGCKEEYPGGVDTSTASPELRELCGSNILCLIDGIELGRDGAQSFLEARAMIGSSSLLQVWPAQIVAGVPALLIITVDLSTSLGVPVNLEGYDIYQVNDLTREVESSVLVRLIQIGGDGNQIFSNVLDLSAAEAGLSLGFQAVPVFDGEPDHNSTFVLTSLNAVGVYALESGIVSVETPEPSMSPQPTGFASMSPTPAYSSSLCSSEAPSSTAHPTVAPDADVFFPSIEGLHILLEYTSSALSDDDDQEILIVISDSDECVEKSFYRNSAYISVEDHPSNSATKRVRVLLDDSYDDEPDWSGALFIWQTGYSTTLDSFTAFAETETDGNLLRLFSYTADPLDPCSPPAFPYYTLVTVVSVLDDGRAQLRMNFYYACVQPFQ